MRFDLRQLCARPSERPSGRRADLAAMTQVVIGKHACHHGLADGDGSNSHARIVSSLGDNLGLGPVSIDGAPGVSPSLHFDLACAKIFNKAFTCATSVGAGTSARRLRCYGIRSQSRADYAGNKGSALSSVAAYAARNRGPRGDEPSSTGLFGLNKAACSLAS